MPTTTILITGATGFIGGSIAKHWANNGLLQPGDVHLRALVRDPSSKRAQNLVHNGVELKTGDLVNLESVGEVTTGCDYVIHAATDTIMNSPQLTWKIGVEATQTLFKLASKSGVKRFIFISSMAVYGGMDGQVDEGIRPVPWGDLYGDSKIAAENGLLQDAGDPSNSELTILRFPFVYGIESPRWTLEPLEQARRNRLYIPGQGLLPTPYLHVDNMVAAVSAAVNSQKAGIYNIFDGGTTYLEFMKYYTDMVGTEPKFIPSWLFMGLATGAEFYSRITGKYLPLNRKTARRMLIETRGPWPRAEKAMRELGWKPGIGLQEGMLLIREQLKTDSRPLPV